MGIHGGCGYYDYIGESCNVLYFAYCLCSWYSKWSNRAGVFYDKDVQDRVVELRLITRERIKRNSIISSIELFAPVLLLVPTMVYCMNGARGF